MQHSPRHSAQNRTTRRTSPVTVVRGVLGMSLSELAGAAAIYPGRLGRIEAGAPMTTAERSLIAGALGSAMARAS